MHFNKKLNQRLKLLFKNFKIKYNIFKNLPIGINYKYVILPFIVICLERLYNIFQEDLLSITMQYYENFLNLTFPNLIIIILLIFLFWVLLFYNYCGEGLYFFRTLHFYIISIFLSLIFSYSVTVAKIIIIFIKCLTLLGIFLMYYDKIVPSKEKKKVEKIIFNGVVSIFQSRLMESPSAEDFIMFFQPLSQIGKFQKNTSKDRVGEQLYPICRSFHMIDNYVLVIYVKATDIKDLNKRYVITTPYKNKIKNFNAILYFLIAYLNKNTKNQEVIIKKLNAFLNTLKNKQTPLYKVFTLFDLFQFIEENNHLLPEIIKFLKNLKMENIPNCSIQKNININEIKGLHLLIKIYPFFTQSFHLKNDATKLESDLYIFLSKFTSFPKEEILNLKDRNILILFLFLVLNEKNLQINQFTNDIITILKNHNNKF